MSEDVKFFILWIFLLLTCVQFYSWLVIYQRFERLSKMYEEVTRRLKLYQGGKGKNAQWKRK